MRRPLLALLLPLVALGGCRVDATVEAHVTGTGGEVSARFTLDREAVALLGGSVAGETQKQDLEQAGWEITPIRETDGGGAGIGLSKAFHRPQDLGAVMAELAGPEGPLRAFRLDRRRSFVRETFRLRGTADLGPGAAAATGFANLPDLPARLRAAGVDPGRVEELLASRAVDGFNLRLVVELPGRKAETIEVRRGEPTAVDLASETTDPSRPVLLGVALVSGLIVVFRLRRRTSQT